MNILNTFPDKDKLLNWYHNQSKSHVYKVNGHIHTPFSFSSFHSVDEAFELALKEDIKVLGINDFFVTDGYTAFYENAIKHKIFPLFNIEFIGLIKEAQSNKIRINDPNNPGRIYFSGKGLHYPFSIDSENFKILKTLIKESQVQVKEMIEKANQWFEEVEFQLHLSYDEIKSAFAKELVRERHIAKAIRFIIFGKSSIEEERKKMFEKIFDGKPLKSKLSDIPSLENEIRSNLLKAGGKAFVEEDDKSFLDLETLKKIIISAGGIPCYPVLLDDSAGKIMEFEADFQSLYNELSKRNIYCIELIPNRNDFECLKKFVRFFNEKGYVILFGTEHNTPDLIPLTVCTRGNKPIDAELEQISFEGACVTAAHQYLKSQNQEGYLDKNGVPRVSEKNDFVHLGKAVIEFFLHA